MKSKKTVRKWNNILVGSLSVLLLANLVMMIVFSLTLGSKVGEAVELGKPQEGILTLIAPSDCPKCQNFDAFKQYIAKQNVEFTEEQTFPADSDKGKELIGKYEIEKLPTLIFESEDKIKTKLKSAIEQDGRVIGEKTIVWEQNFPPYFDLKENTTIGLVKATFLTDESCSDCYDVLKTQKTILANLGVITGAEESIDVSSSEGRNLLNKYDITKVPTIILSKEAKLYKTVTSVWNKVGTIETDGSLIFRGMEVIKAKYRNLETGGIEGPA